MTGPEVIALASVIASGIVGLTVGFGGPIVSALQQRKAEHLRYIQEQRAKAYADALTLAQREILVLERFSPTYISPTEVPPPMSPLERFEIYTHLSMYGSYEFRKLFEEDWRALLEKRAASELQRLRLQEKSMVPGVTYESSMPEILRQARILYRRMQDKAAEEMQGVNR